MRRITGVAFSAALVAALGMTSPAGAAVASASSPEARGTGFGLAAHAFGTKIDRNPVLASGPTANSIIGCTTLAGVDRRNHLAAEDAGPLLTATEVDSHNFTRRDGGVVSVTSRNTIARGSLLGGDVRFRGLSSQSKTWHDANGFHNQVRMSLVGLKIGGEPVELTGGTQTLDVSPIAKLTVFDRATSKTATKASARGTVLILKLIGGDDKGTRVQVGFSKSQMLARVFGPMSGSTWGSRVTVGDTISSGRTAFQVMPCQGTKGEVVENTTAGVTLPGILNADAIATHKWGVQRPLVQKGYTQAEIANATVGGPMGLVVEAIVSKANVKRENGELTRNARGTKLLSVTLAGVDVEDQLVPGQPVDLAGLGQVTFKKVTKIKNGIDVVALDIVLLDNTHIELGHSIMRIKPN